MDITKKGINKRKRGNLDKRKETRKRERKRERERERERDLRMNENVCRKQFV